MDVTMAHGAKGDYWKVSHQSGRLQGVLKHGILKRYLPVFLSRTSSKADEAAYLDGYAGRGKHLDGSPGSAKIILDLAVNQKYSMGRHYRLFLYERDRENFSHLKPLVDSYKSRGVDVEADRCEVQSKLPHVLAESESMPLFAFLDPCGVGVPFDDLCDLLNRSQDRWPPTEALLNFSHVAVRRIGGLLKAEGDFDASVQTLSRSLGGDWWIDTYRTLDGDDGVQFVVETFKERLAKHTGMSVFSVAVRPGPTQKPLYDLVFATRYRPALWSFAHNTALSVKDWWDASESVEDELTLFAREPQLSDVEDEALATIKGNIVNLMKNGPFIAGEAPEEVFGAYLGRVRETVVRKAVRELHKEGRTTCDGKGTIEKLRISPT